VHSIYNGYWYFGRPTLDELRLDLRAIMAEVRPDWDLAAPGLRARWDAGDHDAFYPYGKTHAQVFAEQD
jgi:hypothetical protein